MLPVAAVSALPVSVSPSLWLLAELVDWWAVAVIPIYTIPLDMLDINYHKSVNKDKMSFLSLPC